MITKLSLMIHKIVAKTESRFTLNGIFLTNKETVATDSHRLTRVKHLAPADKMDKHVVLKSADAAQLSKMAGKNPVEITSANALLYALGHQADISFKSEGLNVTFEPLEGRFPDYERCVPDSLDWTCITFDPKYMKDLMEIHAAADGCVRMYVHPNNPNSHPIILESAREDGQDVQSLLMPIREAVGYQSRRYAVMLASPF
jgi:DNA polymerase III sliding clamp (beta) subunit (PCNA family)